MKPYSEGVINGIISAICIINQKYVEKKGKITLREIIKELKGEAEKMEEKTGTN